MVSACSEKESAETYISEAEVLIVEQQYNEAIISLKNALKVDAKNAKARFTLGKLYLDLGHAEQATKELERAHKFKYKLDKVFPLLARAYMLTEDDENILSLAPQVALLSTVSTKYLAYKTMAALRTGDKELAEQTVKEAFSVSQNDGFSMLASAYFEFSNQNIEHASTLVERILVATPNNADATMLQGQIALADKRYSLAVNSFKQYLKFQPNSARVLLFIADALLKDGEFKEAEKIADDILVKVPTQPFMKYIKAMARFEDKDYEAASDYANQSLNSGFNSVSLKLVAGASAFYLQNHEQSNHHLSGLMPYLVSNHPARRMLAISQLKLGLIDNISETLTGYDSSDKESSHFLSTLSYELLEIGAFEKAKEMASYATNSDDMTAEQAARAGVLKLMMNDPSGIDNLELALQQNPELISAELALAFASIQAGNLSRAKDISEKWLKEYPDKAGGYNLQAAIFFKKNKLEQGKISLEKSLKLEPNNAYALIQLVKLASHQEETNQAELLSEQALKAHPKNIEVLRQYFAIHKDEVGLKILSEAQQSNASEIQYGILLAEALLHLERFDQASSILEGYQLNVKTPKRYWQILLAVNAKQTDGMDEFLLLDKWQKNNEYHIEPVFLLVKYWASKRSPDKALSVLEHAFKKHPNNLMIHLVKMQILLNNNRSSEAKLLFKALSKFEINRDLIAGIEGRILLLDEKYREAIPKLEQQYQAKPSAINVTFLAAALNGNNQKAEAIKLLEVFSDKEKSNNKIHPRVSLRLANMYLGEHHEKAIVEYEKLIKVTPENIVVLNNLSWLYMENGNFSQALNYSKKAYALNAKIANVVDTYAQALLKSGKRKEALSKAREAHKLSNAKNVDIALNLVETLLANEKKQEAKIILEGINTVTVQQNEKKQNLLK